MRAALYSPRQDFGRTIVPHLPSNQNISPPEPRYPKPLGAPQVQLADSTDHTLSPRSAGEGGITPSEPVSFAAPGESGADGEVSESRAALTSPIFVHFLFRSLS